VNGPDFLWGVVVGFALVALVLAAGGGASPRHYGDPTTPPPPPRDVGAIPDAEIDYDHVTLADVRRMSDEQLWRGYEHALKRDGVLPHRPPAHPNRPSDE